MYIKDKIVMLRLLAISLSSNIVVSKGNRASFLYNGEKSSSV